jgi:hypothetical protein
VVDATGATVDNEAELMAASARFSWPLARSCLAVSVQDLMAADTLPSTRAVRHIVMMQIVMALFVANRRSTEPTSCGRRRGAQGTTKVVTRSPA